MSPVARLTASDGAVNARPIGFVACRSMITIATLRSFSRSLRGLREWRVRNRKDQRLEANPPHGLVDECLFPGAVPSAGGAVT